MELYRPAQFITLEDMPQQLFLLQMRWLREDEATVQSVIDQIAREERRRHVERSVLPQPPMSTNVQWGPYQSLVSAVLSFYQGARDDRMAPSKHTELGDQLGWVLVDRCTYELYEAMVDGMPLYFVVMVRLYLAVVGEEEGDILVMSPKGQLQTLTLQNIGWLHGIAADEVYATTVRLRIDAGLSPVPTQRWRYER